jgi:hypothetical protein
LLKVDLLEKLFIPGVRLGGGVVYNRVLDADHRPLTLIFGTLAAAGQWLWPAGQELLRGASGLMEGEAIIAEAERDTLCGILALNKTRLHFEPVIGTLLSPEERQVAQLACELI